MDSDFCQFSDMSASLYEWMKAGHLTGVWAHDPWMIWKHYLRVGR